MIDPQAAAILERITARRGKLNIRSVRAAEQRAGKPNCIRNVENGTVQTFTRKTLMALAPVLHTNVEWLATGEGDPERVAIGTADETAARIAEMNEAAAPLQARRARAKRASGMAPAAGRVHLRGEVAAGQWLEVDHVDAPAFEEVTLPADERWPAHVQFGLMVRGTSINRVAADGTFLTCVDAIAIGYEPRNGDLVIVERTRAGGSLRERTAKRYFLNGDVAEFWPDSTDPEWSEPIVIKPDAADEDMEVRLAALVVWVHAAVRAPAEFNPRQAPTTSR